MLLQNKIAVIYGAAGAVGSAVAHTFAEEGATVFLAGRTEATLAAVAADIAKAGGKAEVAPVDGTDAAAVDAHAAAIVRKAGRIDVAFNLIQTGDNQGTPVLDMRPEDFTGTTVAAIRSQFLTSRAVGRQMAKQGSGVILALVAQAGRKPYPNGGSFGVTCSAIEALCRQFAAELGPKGVRVVVIRSAGSPDARGVREAMAIHAAKDGITVDELEKRNAVNSMLKRMPRLKEVANAAAMMASDRASAITGAVANVTCGETAD